MSGDLAEEIKRLREEPGKDILVHGGPRLAQSLADADLIDEYRLVVHPVALGEGARLFPTKIELERVEASPFPAGAVALVYRRPR